MNKQLQKLQKLSGVKLNNFDNKKNELYHQSKILLQALTLFVKSIEMEKMYNEQFYLDFEDSLNALSVKDHDQIL